MILCLLMFMASGKSMYYVTLAYTSISLVFFLVGWFSICEIFCELSMVPVESQWMPNCRNKRFPFSAANCEEFCLWRPSQLFGRWRKEEEADACYLHCRLTTSHHVVADQVGSWRIFVILTYWYSGLLWRDSGSMNGKNMTEFSSCLSATSKLLLKVVYWLFLSPGLNTLNIRLAVS